MSRLRLKLCSWPLRLIPVQLMTIFVLYKYSAKCLQLGMKNGRNFGFLSPVHFRGHFEEISIAKVLLETKPHHVGKFRDVGFFDV